MAANWNAPDSPTCSEYRRYRSFSINFKDPRDAISRDDKYTKGYIHIYSRSSLADLSGRLTSVYDVNLERVIHPWISTYDVNYVIDIAHFFLNKIEN